MHGIFLIFLKIKGAKLEFFKMAREPLSMLHRAGKVNITKAIGNTLGYARIFKRGIGFRAFKMPEVFLLSSAQFVMAAPRLMAVLDPALCGYRRLPRCQAPDGTTTSPAWASLLSQ
jgi:hypothetical protein